MQTCLECRGWGDEDGLGPCVSCEGSGVVSVDDLVGELDFEEGSIIRCPKCQGWDCDPEYGCRYD